MFKRIMKITGVVVGAVAVFVGAVIGVMAAMGKFKKKKIYPNRLFFAETEQVIVYDASKPDEWYSFMVMGENTETTNSVNQKSCYVSFENSDAADLIELYSKNKEKLIANTSGRFEVECNEPIYYKVKPQIADFSGTSFGRAEIRAMGEELSMVASSENLTIWVDRKIDLLQLKNASSNAVSGVKDASQNVTVATTEKLYFDYSAQPFASLYPTTKADVGSKKYGKKIVELYYYDKAESKYEQITRDNYNVAGAGYSGLIGWDNEAGLLYFTSPEIETYDFYIATFATYQDRFDYEEELLANPDHTPSERQRLDNMVVTNLKVTTYDKGIREVAINADDITLDLRNENVLVVNHTKNQSTNLQLQMMDKNGEDNQDRFNSIVFADDLSDFLIVGNGIVTMKTNPTTSDLYIKLDDVVVSGGASPSIVIDTNSYYLQELGLSIGDYKLIYLTNNVGLKYICSNGYLLWNQATNKLSLLSAGTYFGLFNESGEMLINVGDADSDGYQDFFYSADVVSGTFNNEKSWNVNIKEYNADEISAVRLVCLAVNSRDAHLYGSVSQPGLVSASYNIEIEEVGMTVNFTNEVVENKISLEAYYEDARNQYAKFSDLVSVDAKTSYNQCVFVTEKSTKYEIAVDDSKTINYDGRDFVLVGYYASNKFVNNIKAIKQFDGVDTKVYVMQLKTGHNELLENFTSSSNYVCHLIKTEKPLTVDVLFKMTDEINFAFGGDDIVVDNGKHDVYEKNTSSADNVITVSGNELELLKTAGLTSGNFKDYFKVLIEDSSIETEAIELMSFDETTGEIKFDTKNYNSDDEFYRVSVKFNNVVIKSDKIALVSITPTDVEYQDGGTVVELYVGENLEDYDKAEYQITLGYDGEIKATNFYLGGYDSELVLNADTTATGARFVTVLNDVNDPIKQTFNYFSTNNEIFEIDETDNSWDIKRINKTDETVFLKVETESGYVGYLKVKIIQDGKFDFENVEEKEITTANEIYNLKDDLPYTYDATQINKEVILDDILISSFGVYGTIIKDGYNFYLEVKDADHLFLTINETVEGWQFERKNHKFTNLTVSFKASVPTSENEVSVTLNFEPATQINFNSDWNNQQVYKDTTILFNEEIMTVRSGATTGATFTEKSYYRIKNNTDIPVSVTKVTFNDEGVDISDTVLRYDMVNIAGTDPEQQYKQYKFTPNATGTYHFTFSNNEERTIKVVDNVVADLRGVDFKSEEDVNFVSLKSYASGVTYGTTSVGIYPKDRLTVDIDFDDNLAIIDGVNKNLKYDGSKFSTSQIESLNTTEIIENISLQYNGNKVVIFNGENKVDSIDINVENKYTVTSASDVKIEAYREKDVNSTGNDLSVSFISIAQASVYKTNVLTSVSVAGASWTFDYIDNNKVKLTSHLGQVYNNQTTRFTFTIDGKVYTYDMEIDYKPYTPVENVEFNGTNGYEIYSGDTTVSTRKTWQEYFFSTTIVTGKSTQVYHNYDSAQITNIVAESLDTSVIAFSGDNFEIKDIVGLTRTVGLRFKFTYQSGETYTISRMIKVTNAQIVEVYYPFHGLEIPHSSLVEKSTINSDIDIDVKDVIMIGQTINLLGDEVFPARIDVTNHAGASVSEIKDHIQSIELIAYSPNLQSYYQNNLIVINKELLTIEFKTPSANYILDGVDSGFVLFNIKTKSNAYNYYAVQLCNKPAVTLHKNYNIDVNSGASEIDFISSGNILGAEISTILGQYTGIGTEVSRTYFYLMNVSGIGESEIPTNLIRQNLEGKKLPAIKNYVTLQVAVLYYNNPYYIYAGTLTLYVAPNGIPGVKAGGEYNGLTKVDEAGNNFNFNTGYYEMDIEYTGAESNKYYLSANGEKILCPFEDSNYKATFISPSSTPAYAEIATGSGEVQIKQYVTTDTTFTIKYWIDDSGDKYIRYVTYTLKAFNITTTAFTKSVGEYDVSGNKFNNILDLREIIGDYNKTIDVVFTPSIKIEGVDISSNTGTYTKVVNGRNVTLKYDSKWILEFEQTTSLYLIDFVVVFKDVFGGEQQRSVRISVNKNIGITLSGDGESNSNPIDTEIEDASTTYTEEYPSYIEIHKEVIGSIYKYTIGGFTLYAGSGDKLELTFSNYAYVADKNKIELSSALTIATGDFDGDIYKLYFTHAGANTPLTVIVKVKDGSGNYYMSNDGGSHESRTLHINVEKTYDEIVVNYIVKGANHENITQYTSGKASIALTSDGFFKDLTGSATDIESGDSVLNNNRFTLKLEGSAISSPDLTGMGFFTTGNPNKFTFNAGQNYRLNSGSIEFNQPTNDTWATLTFGNVFKSLQYNFNIMQGSNGFTDYPNMINGLNVTHSTPYALVTVNDNMETNIQVEIVSEHRLARIVDSRNSVKYITGMLIDGTAITSANVEIITHGQGGKTYRVTQDNYVFEISILDDGDINVRLSGLSGRTKFGHRIYKFTLYGDSKVVENFEIVFANYTINGMTGDSTNSNTIFLEGEGGSGAKISIVNNLDGSAQDLSNANLVVTNNESYYTVDGKTTYINSVLSNDNKMFDYSNINNTISMRTIAEPVSIHLVFEVVVQLGSTKYNLGKVIYEFVALRNFDYYINGTKVIDNSFRTDYMLKTQNVSSNKHVDNLASQTNPALAEIVDEGVTTRYSQDLLFQMKRTDGSDVTHNMYDETELISNMPDVANFELSNKSLVFEKDYTGMLELTVEFDFTSYGRGYYSFIWRINILGLITMTPSDAVSEGEGFASGSKVYLLGNVDNANQGIDFVDQHAKGTSSPNNIAVSSVTINYIVESTLVERTDEEMGTEFTKTGNLAISEIDFYHETGEYSTGADSVENALLDKDVLKVKLPLVPQSVTTPNTKYFVTYQVNINYTFGTQTKYVTYAVYNEKSVDANSVTRQIDVSDDSGDGLYVATDTKLLIFKYQGTGATDTNKPLYVFNEKIVDGEKIFGLKDIENMYVRLTCVSMDADNTENTVFEGRNCIYYPITKTQTQGSSTPASEDDDVYTYSIDISQPYASVKVVDGKVVVDDSLSIILEENTNALFNNLLNAKIEVMSGYQPVTGIDAYDEIDNETGFQLYTSNSIRSQAEANGKPEYTFGQIFPNSAWYSNNGEVVSTWFNKKVLGVGDPANSWVTNSSGTPTTTDVGKITVPLFIGNDECIVKKATYSGDGNELYNLSQSFYYVDGKSSIDRPDYSFGFSFTVSTARDYVFDPVERFKTYKMDASSKYLEKVDVVVVGTASVNESYIIGGTTYNPDTTHTDYSVPIAVVSNKIYISKAFLQAWKNNHPTDLSVTIDFMYKNVRFSIELALPQNATMNIAGGAMQADKSIAVEKTVAASLAGNSLYNLLASGGVSIDTYIVNASNKIELTSGIDADDVTNVEVLAGEQYVNIVKTGDTFESVNILQGSNTASGLENKNSIHKYLYVQAHEQLERPIKIRITYKVAEDNEISTTFIINYKKS